MDGSGPATCRCRPHAGTRAGQDSGPRVAPRASTTAWRAGRERSQAGPAACPPDQSAARPDRLSHHALRHSTCHHTIECGTNYRGVPADPVNGFMRGAVWDQWPLSSGEVHVSGDPRGLRPLNRVDGRGGAGPVGRGCARPGRPGSVVRVSIPGSAYTDGDADTKARAFQNDTRRSNEAEEPRWPVTRRPVRAVCRAVSGYPARKDAAAPAAACESAGRYGSGPDGSGS